MGESFIFKLLKYDSYNGTKEHHLLLGENLHWQEQEQEVPCCWCLAKSKQYSWTNLEGKNSWNEIKWKSKSWETKF